MSYIKLKTKIPNPKDLKLIKELEKVSPRSMQEHQLPIVWNKAENFLVYDRWGNRFIDFTSTIFVTNSGHSNPDICNAIRKKVNNHLIHTYTFPNEIRLKFLQKLTKFTGFEKAFLLSSGTESTEAACKIMRLATNKQFILSFQGAMHGKTFFADCLRGNEVSLNNIVLLYPKQSYDWKNTLKEFSKNLIDKIAGIIIETYRGWDCNFFSTFYIQELVKWTRENKILICFDEIQAGFGRTGKLFGYEWYKIPRPDLICCGKGLGGGIPISAVLGSKKLLDIPDDLSSTNSANPLVCSGALANIQYIEKYKLIERSFELGKRLKERLEKLYIKFNIIVQYSSKGLVGALVFQNKKLADEVCYRCVKKGLLLVYTGRESIKIGPPLIITKSALSEGLDILEEVIYGLEK